MIHKVSNLLGDISVLICPKLNDLKLTDLKTFPHVQNH